MKRGREGEGEEGGKMMERRREGEVDMVSVKSRAPLPLTCACSSTGPPPPLLHRAPPPSCSLLSNTADNCS